MCWGEILFFKIVEVVAGLKIDWLSLLVVVIIGLISNESVGSIDVFVGLWYIFVEVVISATTWFVAFENNGVVIVFVVFCELVIKLFVDFVELNVDNVLYIVE